MSQTPTVVVRLVTVEDLPALRAKERRNDSQYVSDSRFTEAGSGEVLYVVALRDDVPMGTVMLDLSDGPMQPELRNMYVYPDARRQGIGRALDQYCEDHARALGYEELFLGVDPDNYQAIPLYLSLGFEPTGNHRFVTIENSEEGVGTVTFHDAIYRKQLRFQ